MIPREEELHDQIIKAFTEYSKANRTWLDRGTKRSAIATRFWLSEIRRLASIRRIKIQDWRHEIDRIKIEKRKLQNQKKEGDDSTT